MNPRIVWVFLKIELSDTYPSVWGWSGMIIGTLLSLLIYWFTSKAFSPFVSKFVVDQGMSYFLFVISGEIVLMLPILALEAPSQVVKQASAYGTLTSILQLPCQHSTPIISWSIAKMATETIRLFMSLLLIFALFGALVSPIIAIRLILLTLLVCPMFLGLGLIAASFVVAFGRGEKAISFAVNALTIFSGIYFPISVLPKGLEHFIRVGSPFHFILQRTRDLVSTRIDYLLTSAELSITLGGGILFLALGIVVLLLSFEYSKSRGSALLIRY